jgi:hypothetical protein
MYGFIWDGENVISKMGSNDTVFWQKGVNMKNVLFLVFFVIISATNVFADLKTEYKNKIISGEIDPTEISFEEFQKTQNLGEVDLKQLYKNKIISGEIDPTQLPFDQFKASKQDNVNSLDSVDSSGSQNLVNQNDVTEINNIATVAAQNTDDVESAVLQYLKKKELHEGLNKHGKHKNSGKYIVYEIVPVTKDTNDARFRDSLTIAYEKAYMGAQKKLLMQIYGKTISEKAMTLFEDNSEGFKEDFVKKLEDAKNVKEQIDTIFGKVAKLAETKLDKALVEEGVSLDKIKSLSVQQKQTLYKDQFTKTVGQGFTLETLLGSVPMQTFVGMYNDAPAIGVVMMKSDKTSIVAQDISMQRKPRLSKVKGVNPFSLLPKNNQEYLKEFGVRLFFDESGFPSLISYAQKGVSYKGDSKSRRAKQIKSAQDAATMRADAQISEFLNVVMTATDKEKNGEIEQTNLKNQLNEITNVEEIVEVSTSRIVNILEKNAKATSKMDNAGLSTIKKWITQDDTGNTSVGAVRLWSYDQLSAAKRVQTGKDVSYGNSVGEKKATKEVFIETQGGNDVMDVNDF